MARKKKDQNPDIIERFRREAEASLKETLTRYGPAMSEMAMKLQPVQASLANLGQSLAIISPTLEQIHEMRKSYEKVMEAFPPGFFTLLEQQEIPEIATQIFIEHQDSTVQKDIEVSLELKDDCLYFVGPDKNLLIKRFYENLPPQYLFIYLMQRPNVPIAREQLSKKFSNLSDTLSKAKMSTLLKQTFFPFVTKYIVQMNPKTTVSQDTYKELVNQLESSSAISEVSSSL